MFVKNPKYTFYTIKSSLKLAYKKNFKFIFLYKSYVKICSAMMAFLNFQLINKHKLLSGSYYEHSNQVTIPSGITYMFP